MAGKHNHVEEDLKRIEGGLSLTSHPTAMTTTHPAAAGAIPAAGVRSRAILIVSLIRSNPERSDNATPAGVVDSHASHSYLGSIKYLRDLPDVSELRWFTWQPKSEAN